MGRALDDILLRVYRTGAKIEAGGKYDPETDLLPVKAAELIEELNNAG